MKTMPKLHELSFELLMHPPYSPELASSDFFRFSDLKSVIAKMNYGDGEEVMAQTENCFEAKGQPHYEYRIEKLEGCYSRCIDDKLC